METMKYKGEEDKVVKGGPDNVVSLSSNGRVQGASKDTVLVKLY